MARATLAFIVAALSCSLSGDVRADKESDRQALLTEVQRLLDGISDDLDRVASDASAGYIDYAVRKADDVKDRATRLRDVADGDATATEIADRYPGYVERFKEAARFLKELKNGQKTLDELPRRCDEKTKELVTKMAAYTKEGDIDPRGSEEIPKLAREYGRVGKEAKEQAERARYELAQWYDKVDDFGESHGGWSDVRSSLYGAGRAIWESFYKVYERIDDDDVCGNLSREERNPLVEAAIEKLFEGKKGIQLLYDQLDRQLGELGAYLNDLESDSTASDIDSATQKATDIERSLDQLDRIRGQDSEARRRVEAHRTALKALREGLEPLKLLKQGQFLVDRATEKCAESEQALRELIDGYKSRRDSKGIKEIPLKARGIAASIKASLANADEHHEKMKTARSEAWDFEASEGGWRDVTSRMRDSITGVWEHWKNAWETAHARCDELTRGDEHPLVKAGLELLVGSSKSLIDAYRKDVDAWFDLTREAFKMDCVALEEIWSAYCEGVDWETGESEGDDEAKAVATRIAKERGEVADDLVELYTELDRRGDALVDDDDVGDQAEQLRENMRKRRYGAVATLIKGGAGLGYQHPLIQFSKRYGEERHLDMMTSSAYACDVMDEPIEGTLSKKGNTGRPDCISADDCRVYEFKPDSDTGREAYADQYGRYLDGVNKFFSKHLAAGTVPPVKGGQQIYDKLLKNSACWDPATKHTSFKMEPKYYRVCEKKFECVQP